MRITSPSILAKKYQLKIATIDDYKDWVYSKARKVDLNDTIERELVEDLDQIMTKCIKKLRAYGVSSNNIFWNGTDVPLRVIQVPDPEGKYYLTLINPEIKELSGETFETIESCSCLPYEGFRVPRKSYVRLVGYILVYQDFKPIELEYGSKEQNYSIQPGLPVNVTQEMGEIIVQHENDHTEGITILECGKKYLYQKQLL